MPPNSEAPDPPRERVRVRIRARSKRHPWRRSRRTRRFALVVGILLGLAVLDAVWAATGVRRDLDRAREQLQRGANALRAGRPVDAEARFQLALGAAREAQHLRRHPTAWLAGVVPGLRDDVGALLTLSRAAELAAEAGGSVTRAAAVVGWDGAGVPGLERGRSLRLGAIRAAAPDLGQAARDLREVQRVLDGLDTDGLFGPIENAVVSARGEASRQRRLVQTADRLARLLPSMLQNSEHRYFLAIQNLSAPRGTGGFLGFYGILKAVDGRISLERLAPTSDLPVVGPVAAPKDVRTRYARFGAQRVVYAANYSPDFPTSARVILEMAQEAGLGRLDGVVAVDTVWVSYILGAIGPVDSPAWPTPITSDNVIGILNRDTFETLDQEASDRLQGRVGLDTWNAILDRTPAAAAFADAMSKAVAERHLQVYARDPEQERIVTALGASGSVELGPNPLFVVWQDFVASRAGFFAEKKTMQHTILHADGSATVETTTTLRDRAPDGPPSILLGTPAEGPIGYYAALINTYLPQTATDIVQRSSGPSVLVQEKEFGHPVTLGLVEAERGGTSSVTTRYSVAHATRRAGGSMEYTINFIPQPSLRPNSLDIQVDLPQGARIVAASPFLSIQGTSLRYLGSPTTPLTIRLVYRLSD